MHDPGHDPPGSTAIDLRSFKNNQIGYAVHELSRIVLTLTFNIISHLMHVCNRSWLDCSFSFLGSESDFSLTVETSDDGLLSIIWAYQLL